MKGDTGTLRWDCVRGSVEIFDSETALWRTIMRHPDDVSSSYRTRWSHFLQCIDDRATPLVTREEGYNTLVVTDCCRETSIEGLKILVSADTLDGQEAP